MVHMVKMGRQVLLEVKERKDNPVGQDSQAQL